MTNDTDVVESQLWELHAVLTDLFHLRHESQLDSLLARYPLYAEGTRNLFDCQTNVSIASQNAVKHAIQIINHSFVFIGGVVDLCRNVSTTQLCGKPSTGNYPLQLDPAILSCTLTSAENVLSLLLQHQLTAAQSISLFFKLGDYTNTETVVEHADRLGSNVRAELSRSCWSGSNTDHADILKRLDCALEIAKNWYPGPDVNSVSVPAHNGDLIDQLSSTLITVKTLEFQTDLVDVLAARDLCYFLATFVNTVGIVSGLLAKYTQLVLSGKEQVC